MQTLMQPQQTLQVPEDDPISSWWGDRLSVSALRTHTKTDDTPGVTDEQIRLYRDSGLAACSAYTGYTFKSKHVTEPVTIPKQLRMGHASFRHNLKHPTNDGMVYLYGGKHGVLLQVPPGSSRVSIPYSYLGSNDPLNPFRNRLQDGLLVSYKTGFASADTVPSHVVQGLFLWVAWSVTHAGDELIGQRNRLSDSSTGGTASTHVGLNSGAIEMWRMGMKL